MVGMLKGSTAYLSLGRGKYIAVFNSYEKDHTTRLLVLILCYPHCGNYLRKGIDGRIKHPETVFLAKDIARSYNGLRESCSKRILYDQALTSIQRGRKVSQDPLHTGM